MKRKASFLNTRIKCTINETKFNKNEEYFNNISNLTFGSRV